MEGIEDTNAQWIILSGFTLSLSLISVAVFLNQAGITGYHSANAVLEFPKHEIRELVAQTRESIIDVAQLAWHLNNTSNESVLINFTKFFNNYTTQVGMIYAVHGETISLTLSKVVFNSTNSIEVVWLNISYSNGDTLYISQPEIIEIR